MRKVNYEPLSPLLFLKRSSIAYQNKLAVIDKHVQKTYHEFYLDCLILSNNFKKFKVYGERIAYLSRNSYPMLLAHYAVPASGAILVPINIRLNSSEVCFILQHSKAKILVVEEDLYQDQYAKLVDKIILIPNQYNNKKVNRFDNYEDLLRNTMDESEVSMKIEDCLDENDTITINYTSGTSGKPKGVMYSHRSTYLNAVGEALEAGLSSQSIYLWVLPMFHCNGWCYTWAVTAVGATHICMESFEPETVIRLIINNSVTHFCAAPTVLIKLSESEDFHTLKYVKKLKVITAGSPPSPKLIELYENHNISVIHVYGLTETHGPHSISIEQNQSHGFNKADIYNMKAKQGVPAIHSTFMRVVDANMNNVPCDGATIGEVVMRGNNVMKGYYNDSKATQKVFEKGWFHSGDVAVIDQNGNIEIKDRMKDIIISGGENISSIEIENVLYKHPYISLAAVVPAYDTLWGEVPHAFIELKKGFKLSEEEVIKFCRISLANFKCPKKVTFRTLPKTSTGKIQKFILKNEYKTANS